MTFVKSFIALSILLTLSLIVGSKVLAVGDPAELIIKIEEPDYTKMKPKVRVTPTPTPVPVCLAEITYARHPKSAYLCKAFSSSCEVPKGWIRVDECPVKPTFPPKKVR